MTQTNKSIAVIGAGIVGVCTALYLQRAGLTVTLYDKEGVAQGASKGNAGHFATEQVFPLADASLLPQIPKMLLDPLGPFRIKFSYLLKAMPWFLKFLRNMLPSRFEQNKLALKALNQVAMAAYLPLIKAADCQHLFRQEGSLLVSENEDVKPLQKLHDQFIQNGVAVSLLNRAQLMALEPNLSDDVKHGLYFKEVGHTADPEALCQTLFQHFLAQGGEYEQKDIKTITQMGDQIILHTGSEQISHKQIVIACGAWSKPLANQLGYKVPLDTERGYHLMLKDKTNELSIPVASLERKFIMTPMTQGLRLAGTVEFAGLEAPANVARAHALLPHAKALLNSNVTEKADELPDWMGFRPSLPDSLPVIGRAPKHNNVYFAFGHQHLGLTQAAITGKILTEQLTNQAISLDLAPYCISRFQ